MSHGFTFNGISSASMGVTMKSKNRQLQPLANDSYLQIPGRQGSYLYPRELADRVILLDCGIVQDTLENLRIKLRAISAWLYTANRASLSFDDEPGISYQAKLDVATDLTQLYTMGTFTLSFLAEPLAYGTQQTASFIADAVTVTNTGTFTSLPIFDATFTAAATEWKAILGSSYVRVVNAFAIGNTLEVDCNTGKVFINGVQAMQLLDWQNTIFFALAVGSNTMTITPAGVCTATVKWTPRWL
jgi:predicted phage tail component-like protein